jgi:hypothetical protein
MRFICVMLCFLLTAELSAQTINLQKIDCGNSHITYDLKDALHEKLYPTINFKL